MLAINLFGSPEVLLDGRPITIERRKSRALLYFLAASERPYQREQLLAFFWPDMERQAAQQVLRTSLHGLHKTLGEALAIEREALSLAQDTQVDARMFEKNLSPIPGDIAKLESILLLYRGAFLTNFSLPDTQSFEDWENAERERYQRLFVRAVYALSRSYEGFGDYKAALAAMDRGLVIDPLQEDLQREAIRLAYLAGDRPESIRRYDQLRKLLDEELGVPPMVETRALYDDILNDRVKIPQPQTLEMARTTRTAKAPTPAGMLPFISREAELKTLTEGILTNRLLLVEGEPGIGKSRLVEQFIGTLPDTIQLCGAGRELELALPYQPVIEALRGLQALQDWPALLAGVRKDLPELWLREAARLMPELGAPAVGSSTAEEWRLWEGISQFLLSLAKAKPVLLFIDDLHWADPSTMGLLGYLVRHAPGSRLSFLAAARPFATRSPLGNLASALTRENRLTRIALDRFSEQDVAKIAEKLSPRQAPELAAWLQRNSEGNPYILSELVWHARRSHLLADDGTLDLDALSTRPVVPQSVYSLIESRLANMSEPARRILDVAVAVGRDFDFDLVTRASAVSENAALDGLDELIELGLVHPDGNMRYRFDHSLTMEVAFREIGEARHRLLHRRIAEAMESMYTRTRPDNLPGLLAFHYSEGNDPRRAAPYAFQAGQSAVRLAAWSEAIAFFEQALVGTEGWPRFPILMELGSAFYQAGQTAQAGETFQSAVALAESQGRQQQINAARLKLAETYLSQARFAESIKQAQKVIQSGRDEDIFRAEMWWGTTLSVEGADLAGAEEHLMRAVNFCREQKDIEALAQLEFELGSVWAQRGDLRQAIDHYRAALNASEKGDSQALIERRALAHNNLAYHLLLLGDPTAIEHAQAGMKLAQDNGLLGFQPYLYSTLGEIALAQKDFQAAETNFNQGLELAKQLVIPERIAGLTANLGLVARERGQKTTAIHRLSTALAKADQLGIPQLAAQIRLWLAPLLPPEEARAQVDEARAIAERDGRKRLLEEAVEVEQQIALEAGR